MAVAGGQSGRGSYVSGPPQGSAGEVPPAAVDTALVAQYPGAKDIPPTIVDDVTPLSAQFHNYLALLIEAIEAEIGPWPPGMVRNNVPCRNLKDLLGTAVMQGLSVSRSAGVGAQGRLFGVQQVHITKLANAYATVGVGSISAPFPHPRGKAPLFFAITEAPPSGVNDLVLGPAIVRGHAFLSSANTIQYEYRGARGTPTGPFDPTGSAPIRMDAVIFYLVADEDA